MSVTRRPDCSRRQQQLRVHAEHRAAHALCGTEPDVPMHFAEEDLLIAEQIEKNNQDSTHRWRAKVGGATLWVMHLTGHGSEDLRPNIERQENIGTRALVVGGMATATFCSLLIRAKTGL